MTSTVHAPQDAFEHNLRDAVKAAGKPLGKLGVYGVMVLTNDEGKVWVISPLSDEHCVALLDSAAEVTRRKLGQ